jgi:predicted component of viral defense system (DUF524 family)
MLGSLVIVDRHRKAPADPLSHGRRGYTLRGELEWIVHGPVDEIDALSSALGGFWEQHSPTSGIMSFGNTVGTFVVADLGVLEVRCGKLTEAAFDVLLKELTENLTSLPFKADLCGAHAFEHTTAVDADALMPAFLFARSLLLGKDRPLAHALETIARDPHRRLVSARIREPLACVANVDAKTLEGLVRGEGAFVRAQGPARETPLAHALRGHLPSVVDAALARSSIDTLENRFVRYVCEEIAWLARRVLRHAATKSTRPWAGIAADARAIIAVLAAAATHTPLREASRLSLLPHASTVLQSRRGYREIFQIAIRLRRAAKVSFDDERAALLCGMKDAAELYELWTFFAVVASVTRALGQAPEHAEPHARGELGAHKVRRGFSVRWQDGITVHYNLSFSPNAKAFSSVSVQLRPDIVVEESGGLHVLDAKLRVDRSDGSQSWREDDLLKMHSYRDALPRVRSAFVLYPGRETEVFSHSSPETTGGPGLSDAVGAIGLFPGDGTDELDKHIRAICNRAH